MLVLAHRGAHDPESPGVRENTLEAFRRAGRVGADGVELDVRPTADGVLVVHHDAALPDGRPIAGTARRDLPEWIPDLEEALVACAGMALVNVELKASPLEPAFDPEYGPARAVAGLLAGSHHAALLVSSFNLAALDVVHTAAPGIPTGWLTMTGFDQERAAADAAARGHAALNPPEAQVTPELVETVQSLGLRMVAWTVNDGARMAELAGMGVDVLVTDVPAGARAALGQSKPG